MTDSAMPQLKIVGIISDFHLYSLHDKTEPLTIDISQASPVSYAFIKTRSNNPTAVMNMLQKAYKEIHPGKEFNASFLNEKYRALVSKRKTFINAAWHFFYCCNFTLLLRFICLSIVNDTTTNQRNWHAQSAWCFYL